MAAIGVSLADDGTTDTVFRCDGCGEEARYNYEPTLDHFDDGYEEFLEWAAEDFANNHECREE